MTDNTPDMRRPGRDGDGDGRGGPGAGRGVHAADLDGPAGAKVGARERDGRTHRSDVRGGDEAGWGGCRSTAAGGEEQDEEYTGHGPADTPP